MRSVRIKSEWDFNEIDIGPLSPGKLLCRDLRAELAGLDPGGMARGGSAAFLLLAGIVGACRCGNPRALDRARLARG